MTTTSIISHRNQKGRVRRALSAMQTSLVLLSATAIEHAFAADRIEAPNYVNNVGAESVKNAGAELNKWVFVFMAVVVAASALRPSFHFFNGRTQDAVDSWKDILYGAVTAGIGGPIAFALIKAVS